MHLRNFRYAFASAPHVKHRLRLPSDLLSGELVNLVMQYGKDIIDGKVEATEL
jgi:hypothetical protein